MRSPLNTIVLPVRNSTASLGINLGRVDEEAFASDSNFIKAMIHFQDDIDLFGEAEARKNLFEVDPQAQFALTLFDEATSLLKLSNTSTLVAAR